MLEENWSKISDDDGWNYAETHNIIDRVPPEQTGNLGRWELLEEKEDPVKIEL